jgi:hypothetical protein
MNKIENAISLEEVVEIVNNIHDVHSNSYYGGTDLRSAKALPGEYVAGAAIKSGYIDFESLDGHSETLEVCGIKFDYATALEAAKKYRIIQ